MSEDLETMKLQLEFIKNDKKKVIKLFDEE